MADRRKINSFLWLQEEAQDQVIDLVHRKHRPIVRMIFYHGLRLAEARSMKRKDVEIRQHDGEWIGNVKVKTIKGGPERRLSLEPRVIEDIRSMPISFNLYLFTNNGKKYAKTTLWKIIRKALDDAGLRNVTPNQAGRHSHISQLWRRGAPATEIQYRAGHSDIRTTMVYSHASDLDRDKYGRGVTEALPKRKKVGLKDLSG